MQGGVADQYPGHLNRLQTRNRRYRAGTPHLELHVAHEGHLLLGRELKGYRPAWRSGDKAQLFLKREGVYFDHHPVDIKAERRTVCFNLTIKRQHGFR